MTRPTLQVKRAFPDSQIPTYGSEGAAGMDFYAHVQGDVTIQPGEKALISTGIKIAPPPEYWLMLAIRSGLANKHALTLQNAIGVIDPDYRDCVGAIVRNEGTEAFTITHGLRFCQGILMPRFVPNIVDVEALDETERGVGGFGSTGTH